MVPSFVSDGRLLLVLCVGIGAILFLRSFFADLASFLVNTSLSFTRPIRSVDGRKKLPTAPWRWPNGQGDVGKFLEGLKNSKAWRTDYGGVYRIWSGTHDEIVLTRPEDVKKVFADSDKHTKAHFNNTGWLFGELLGYCLGEINGIHRTSLLRFLSASFTYKKSREYVGMVEGHVQTCLDEAKKPLADNGILNPARDLRYSSFHVIAEVLFGKLSVQQSERLMKLVPVREKLLMKAFTGTVTRYSWSRFLPSETNRELTQFQREWEECIFSLAKSNRDHDGPAQALVRAIDAGQADKRSALQTLDEMLFANLDVTLGALAWSIVLVAEKMDLQQKLRQEIHEGRQDWTSYLCDSSTLLSAVVLESGRLRPIVAFSIPQAAPTDRVVSNFVIPRGTNYIVDSEALNSSKAVWGDDAEEFKPERWLKSGSDVRYQYWRFGFGPRQCLGKYVADLVIRSTIVELLERYSLTLDPEACDTRARDPNVWITMPTARVKCTSI